MPGAQASGYVTRRIDRNAHIDAIHAINNSVGQRQGLADGCQLPGKADQFRCARPLRLLRRVRQRGQAGRLRQHRPLRQFLRVLAADRLPQQRRHHAFAHHRHRGLGLIDEGKVEYVMYDTFFGALPGMQQFKTILGFQPYRARFSLQ
ncbi:hypothetical protein LP419_02950 [Massilia sp. H-1]|nr:hypothetical protein LP419_02950 [Massilia sp. H-1]